MCWETRSTARSSLANGDFLPLIGGLETFWKLKIAGGPGGGSGVHWGVAPAKGLVLVGVSGVSS